MTDTIEIKLVPVGEWQGHSRGALAITTEHIRSAAAYFASRGVHVPVDYEHQTQSGEEAPAAGWITAVEDRGSEGLFGTVEWTERARGFIEAGEYKYLSPVLAFDWQHPESGDAVPMALLSAGLTNVPFFDSLGEVRAKIESLYPQVVVNDVALDTGREAARAGDAHEALALRADAASLLGTGPARSEILAKITELCAFRNGGAVAREEYERLHGEFARLRAERLLARNARKVPPALQSWWLNRAVEAYDDAEAALAALPEIIRAPLVPASLPVPGAEAPLTEDERRVCRATGTDTATFLSWKQQQHQQEV